MCENSFTFTAKNLENHSENETFIATYIAQTNKWVITTQHKYIDFSSEEIVFHTLMNSFRSVKKIIDSFQTHFIYEKDSIELSIVVDYLDEGSIDIILNKMDNNIQQVLYTNIQQLKLEKEELIKQLHKKEEEDKCKTYRLNISEKKEEIVTKKLEYFYQFCPFVHTPSDNETLNVTITLDTIKRISHCLLMVTTTSMSVNQYKQPYLYISPITFDLAFKYNIQLYHIEKNQMFLNHPDPTEQMKQIPSFTDLRYCDINDMNLPLLFNIVQELYNLEFISSSIEEYIINSMNEKKWSITLTLRNTGNRKIFYSYNFGDESKKGKDVMEIYNIMSQTISPNRKNILTPKRLSFVKG